MMKRYPSRPYTADHLRDIDLTDWRVLADVANRRLDLNDLACQALASRGLDHQGEFVGSPKAREIYERTRDAVPEASARPDGPTNIIETTITATMQMHEQRPAMNQHERRHTQLALIETVRATLSNTFLRYEPTGSGAHVTDVTVSFSGHVAE